MKNVYAALLKAVQGFDPVLKDAVNPAFRSKYATLSAVLEAVEPSLHKHGLLILGSLRSDVTSAGLMVYIGLAVCHAESGELIQSELGLIPSKQDPQGVGSAISYGRRYLLMTMLGLAAEDDDGNGGPFAQRPAQSQARPAPTKPQPQAAKPAVNRPDWKGTPEAIIWAMEQGAYADEAAARGALKAALQRVYPGRDSCKPHELPAVLDAFHADVLSHLQKEPAA